MQLKSERGAKAYTYLKDRGLSDDTIRTFGLGYSNIFSDDLYQYLRREGYSEELIRRAGLINTDEKKGFTTSSGTGDFPNHGCQQPGNRLRRQSDGRRKAQIPELSGDRGVR